MRYVINFDKTLNQLVPYYLGGRRLILFLQSCMKPLQRINDMFVEYAKETRIEASMTSQIFKLEWFLNRKFKKYFDNPFELITIKNGKQLGVPVYNESATNIPDEDELKLWYDSEDIGLSNSPQFHWDNEFTEDSSHSFYVYVPKLYEQKDNNGNAIGQLRDGISIEQFQAMLSFWVDKYRLAGKSYKIIFNQ